MYVDRTKFMTAICTLEKRGSLRIKKYDIPELKRNYIYESFYKYMINKYNNCNINIAEKSISRDFNIYIDRFYYYETLNSISKKYNISVGRVGQIIKKIEHRFYKFYTNIKPDTIASLNLDTRIYNCLVRTRKFDLYNDSIDKLYEYNKEFYLKKIRNFGLKSFDKLNKILVENGYSEIQ
jgi:hypothetical protein